MTVAAVYVRKSTAQDAVPDEARSVTRQIDGARAFIESKGWTLDEAHVYTFDAPVRYDELFSGIVVPVPEFMRPDIGKHDGWEHLTAEDTMDGEYSRLLAAATARARQKAVKGYVPNARECDIPTPNAPKNGAGYGIRL